MNLLTYLQLAGTVGIASAQKHGGGTPQPVATECETGYSLLAGHCSPDPCNANEAVRAPANGGLGSCQTREFEFIHLRPNPIDESDIAIASIAGSLATIGVPFSTWTADGSTTFNNGAVFWADPRVGPNATTGVQVAQLTIPTGEIFSARLNFQGRTFSGCTNDGTTDDQDIEDGCMGNDWEEEEVWFTNDAAAMARTQTTYEFLTPSIAVIAGPNHEAVGIDGYTTFKLIIHLQNDAANVYALYGDEEAPAMLPPAYQVTAPGFGADIGGTHSTFWSMLPESQWDSYLTLGHIDMDHPDILDNLHMMADDESCALTCDSGFALASAAGGLARQPECHAGVISMDAVCQSSDGTATIVDPAPNTAPVLGAAAAPSDYTQDTAQDTEGTPTNTGENSANFSWVQIGAAGAGLLTVAAVVAAFASKSRTTIGVAKGAEFQAGACSDVVAPGSVNSAENPSWGEFTVEH